MLEMCRYQATHRAAVKVFLLQGAVDNKQQQDLHAVEWQVLQLKATLLEAWEV